MFSEKPGSSMTSDNGSRVIESSQHEQTQQIIHELAHAGDIDAESRSVFEQALFSVEDAALVLKDRISPMMHFLKLKDDGVKEPESPSTSIVVARLDVVTGVLLDILHRLDI